MPLNVFYSHAPIDREYLHALRRHLAPLKTAGLIKDWSNDEIVPGARREDVIKRHLDESDIVILLVSADYLADEDCQKQVEVALRRQVKFGVAVIPVVIRSVLWEHSPLAGLSALPKDRPVRSYKETDQAWVEVAEGIRRVIMELGGSTKTGSPLPVPELRAVAAMTAWDQIHVGVLVTTREEFRELHREILQDSSIEVLRSPDAQEVYYQFQLAGSAAARPYNCIAMLVGGQSETAAALSTGALLRRFSPRSVVLMGIATGLRSDVHLGDVVVAAQVDSYLHQAAAGDASDAKRFDLRFAGVTYRPSSKILTVLRNFEFSHYDLYESWRRRCAGDLKALLPRDADRVRLRQADLLGDLVRLMDGDLASGPILSRSPEFASWLKSRNRQYLAIDMEAGGAMAAAQTHEGLVQTLVLCGVAEVVDAPRMASEWVGDPTLRRFAIRNCIRLLRVLLMGGALPQE